ncbi:MAG: DUF4845 domain-containing protein [Dechloromonas sp.]|nr:DUF4845 domain-containing protein [Dechloromonas sp.]
MNTQRGIALGSLLFWAIILVVLVTTGLKIVPSAIDYYKLQKDIRAVVAQAGPEATVADLRKTYQRFAEVDMLEFPASELDISKERGQIVIEFAYEKRIPLFANVSLVIDYKGSSAE